MERLFADLARIHQETLLPEVERIVQASERRLTERMVGFFDSLAR